MDSVKADSSARPQFSDSATEAIGAYGGGCLTAVPAYAILGLYSLSSMDVSDPDEGVMAALICIGFGSYTLGSAAAANRVGNKNGWSGSFGWSWGLAALTVAGGIGLAAAMASAASGDPQGGGYIAAATGLGYLCMAAAPAMAAVGYNIGAKRRTPQSLPDRLGPPCFSARIEGPREPGEHRAVTLNAKLLTVRF